MDKLVENTLTAIQTHIPDLENVYLPCEFHYHSLPLCVIDAVFSIGVRYRNAQNAVESWCRAQRPAWPLCNADASTRYTIKDFLRVTDGYSGKALTEKFFGGNT